MARGAVRRTTATGLSSRITAQQPLQPVSKFVPGRGGGLHLCRKPTNPAGLPKSFRSGLPILHGLSPQEVKQRGREKVCVCVRERERERERETGTQFVHAGERPRFGLNALPSGGGLPSQSLCPFLPATANSCRRRRTPPPVSVHHTPASADTFFTG
ncbi:uncharacterized protein LY79DRAFT_103759 [Colletotrichum navitas]|uniref:Uncharacterized protein n=1 Tax=Colletotrichum navitas TaxID=681940 RepID=A0AAD8UXX5_9PEZI|nr:uncharacterized protein LY79DRAFT_103759 [Colletotrichum navitas]KAK1566239.1 hypothetical protein LY79DRAFT_103759 [Colletotrichum navitas]